MHQQPVEIATAGRCHMSTNLAGRTARAVTSETEETTQLDSELRSGDDVDDKVVRVDERIETVENRERILNEYVPLSYD